MGQRVAAFIAGVQKGGTTSLDGYFRDHPGLSAPSRKELHFFNNETLDWTQPDYGLLEGAFPPDDGRLRYEATPATLFRPMALPRLRAYNPDARLIMLFRDPVERAWSQWCMEWARGDETLGFSAAIREGRRRLDGLPPADLGHLTFSYVERGFYGAQVRRALALFPPAQLLFLRSEDLAADHRPILARIAAFLEIAPFPDLAPRREHTRPGAALPAGPTHADQALIAALLRADLDDFAALTGIDPQEWSTMRSAIR